MSRTATKAVKFERTPKLVDQVTKFLNDQIENKVYEEGDKLPTENALVEQLGVSRPVIREALSRLIYDGILESRQGSGVMVADSASKITFRLEPFDDSNVTESKNLLELRAILEGDAAFLAAKRRNEGHLKDLEKCLKKIKETSHLDDQSVIEDIKFHESIAIASCNPYLSDFIEFFRNRLKPLFMKTHSIHLHGDTWKFEDHNRIYQAILKKDSEGARNAAIRHIQSAASGLKIKLFD